MPFSRHTPRIAVLVDTASTWGRGIISGIHSYSRQHGNWHLFIESRGTGESLSLPRGWTGDGVIGRIATEEMARHLRRRRLPVVNVSGIQLSSAPFPTVANDVVAVGKMAAEYFLARGFRHFAYLTVRNLEHVVRQREAFRRTVEQAGFECLSHYAPSGADGAHPSWNLKIEDLARWLKSLPKPVAILTWSVCREVVHACHQARLHMPQEVALLSGSEDELLCESSPVPISGVSAACPQIGYEAAALLDRLMHGRRVSLQPRMLAPVGIVTRLSTDTLAITDSALVAALSHIQQNLSRPLAVGAVARAAGISRSGLERRFAEFLHTTPALHISRLRIEQVKLLLRTTTLAVAEISDRTGFSTPEYMTAVFRKSEGVTPLRYRRSQRPA